MRIVLCLTLGAILMCSIAEATEVRIPFSVKEGAFKKELIKQGMNMNRDDDNGDGYVESRGATMVVYLNRRATDQQLEIIKNAAFKCARK